MNIGLIGAQNSHAKHFCNVINGEKKADPGYTIKYLYGGDDPKAAEELCGEFGLILCESEEEVIAKSDALAITYRKGSLHYDPVMKTLKAGKPLFNDKPFAATAKEAAEIAEYAKKNGILLTGGSSVKSLPGVSEAAVEIKRPSTIVLSYAADPKSEYDGYRFYGVHSVEMCLAILGTDYLSVDAFQTGNTVVSTICFKDGSQCILVTAPDFSKPMLSVSSEAQISHREIKMEYQSICPLEFITMLKTGKPPRDYKFYVTAVEILDKIIYSAGL
jgi:predicted dehydrogenase